jgi:hypothetical protein
LPKTLAVGADIASSVFPAKILDVRRHGKLLLMDIEGGFIVPLWEG